MNIQMTVKVRYILNQWLMGAFHDSDLPTLVERGHIKEEHRVYFLSMKGEN
ncbi:hypothetical protein [Bacillus wiedmannii]|uniref:hypothetical protein n=1 Tax=Bacillus wiedmannii TaxID=1890302 RepID=UPI0015CF79FB|nr:hypothetical protein [Bacillus wiedmannii]